MSKIGLVVNAITPVQHENDFVGTYESSHEFSENDLENVKIINIEGIEKPELDEFLRLKRPQQKRVYRSTSANQWVDVIEKKDAWFDDSNWKLVEKNPTYLFSFADIDENDIENLDDVLIPKEDKFLILNKAVSRISLEETNQTTILIVPMVVSK